MRDVHLLLTKIERARRFASAMTDETDRGRFNAMAAELQLELNSIREASGRPERASAKS